MLFGLLNSIFPDNLDYATEIKGVPGIGLSGNFAAPRVNISEKGIVVVFDGKINKDLSMQLKDNGFKISPSKKYQSDNNDKGWYWFAKKEDEALKFANGIAVMTEAAVYDVEANGKEVSFFWTKLTSMDQFNKLTNFTTFGIEGKFYNAKRYIPESIKNQLPVLIKQGKVVWKKFYTVKPDGVPGDPTVVPVSVPATTVSTPATPAVTKLVKSFYATADSWEKLTQKLSKEIQGKKANTPKRMRELSKKQIDRDMAEERVVIYRKLGEAWENDTVPDILRIIEPTKSADHASYFIRSYQSNSYYSVSRSPEVKIMAIPALDLTEKGHEKILLEMQKFLAGSVVVDPIRKVQERIKFLESQTAMTNITGYWPTPDNVIDGMVRYADLQNDDYILEPSAGKGAILDRIKAKTSTEKFESFDIATFERNDRLREILQLKGYPVLGDNFLIEYPRGEKPNKILMNPPFENLLDIDHVTHAFLGWLRPGGTLVAIMGEGVFFRKDRKATEFRKNILDSHNPEGFSEDIYQHYYNGNTISVFKIKPGAFKTSNMGTGVNARMVVIKPVPRRSNEKYKIKLQLQLRLQLRERELKLN